MKGAGPHTCGFLTTGGDLSWIKTLSRRGSGRTAVEDVIGLLALCYPHGVSGPRSSPRRPPTPMLSDKMVPLTLQTGRLWRAGLV